METRFATIDDLPVWSSYFRAADAWLFSLQTLMKNPLETGFGVFYVEPTIVALCIEMYSKALASHLDVAFQAKKFKHNSDAIIVEYKDQLPEFDQIANDRLLMDLIGEYKNTMDVKYGEMYVQAPQNERALLLDAINDLRAELCRRTGLS